MSDHYLSDDPLECGSVTCSEWRAAGSPEPLAFARMRLRSYEWVVGNGHPELAGFLPVLAEAIIRLEARHR